MSLNYHHSYIHDFGTEYFLFRQLLVQSRIKILDILLMLVHIKIVI